MTIFDKDIDKFMEAFRGGNKVKLSNVLVKAFDNNFSCVDFEAISITNVKVINKFNSEEEMEAELYRMKEEKKAMLENYKEMHKNIYDS